MTRRCGRTTVAQLAAASAVLWAVTLLAALTIAGVPGGASTTRDAFAFRLTTGSPGTGADALAYFITNLRVVTAIFVAAWGRSRSGRVGLVIDVLVGLVVAVNAALVGAALGAYGLRAARWFPHLPLEWAALAVALCVYRTSRRRTLSVGAIGPSFVAAVVALIVASGLEAFATP